jgi:hypothetical protein
MVDERFESLVFQSALDLLSEVGRLLVRRLGTRRNRPFLAVRHQMGTIAHGEDVVVAGCLQGWADDELARRAHLQAIKALQYIGTAYAGRPDHELRRNEIATCEKNPVGAYLGHVSAGSDFDAELSKQARSRFRQTLRQRRYDSVCGFDQGDLDVLVRIDFVEPIGDDAAQGAM